MMDSSAFSYNVLLYLIWLSPALLLTIPVLCISLNLMFSRRHRSIIACSFLYGLFLSASVIILARGLILAALEAKSKGNAPQTKCIATGGTCQPSSVDVEQGKQEARGTGYSAGEISEQEWSSSLTSATLGLPFSFALGLAASAVTIGCVTAILVRRYPNETVKSAIVAAGPFMYLFAMVALVSGCFTYLTSPTERPMAAAQFWLLQVCPISASFFSLLLGFVRRADISGNGRAPFPAREDAQSENNHCLSRKLFSLAARFWALFGITLALAPYGPFVFAIFRHRDKSPKSRDHTGIILLLLSVIVATPILVSFLAYIKQRQTERRNLRRREVEAVVLDEVVVAVAGGDKKGSHDITNSMDGHACRGGLEKADSNKRINPENYNNLTTSIITAEAKRLHSASVSTNLSISTEHLVRGCIIREQSSSQRALEHYVLDEYINRSQAAGPPPESDNVATFDDVGVVMGLSPLSTYYRLHLDTKSTRLHNKS